MSMIGRLSAATVALLTPAAAFAAPQSVTESHHYTLADSESRNDARQICATNAKRTALDKAGSVFESELVSRKAETGGTVTDDTKLQMRSYVAAVVSSEVVAETFIVSNDRIMLTCMVRVTFDPDELKRKLQDIAGHGDLRQKLAAQQAQMDILQSQIRSLKDSIKPTSPAAAQPAPQVSQAPPIRPAARTVPPWRSTYAAPPAQAQVPYQSVPVYPTAYYYYWPDYYGAGTAYAYREAYAGWYYAPRRRW